MQGISHQKTETPCQDYICQQPSDNFVCVVAADGAGAAKYSKDGAKIVAEGARDILFTRENTLFELSDDDIRHVVLQNLNEKLQKEAQKLGCSVHEFACTLLFFVSNGEKYIAGNLGDGIIGHKNSSGECLTLLGQERGIYANISYFVTGNNNRKHLRIKRGHFDPFSVYFLMTDGTAECLYNKRNNSYANALKVYCGLMDKYEHMKISHALTTSMYRLFPSNTDDDCALALIVGNTE